MAMYNNSKNEKKHNSKDNQLPVSTADEWFAKEGLTDWPFPVASEGELDIEDMLEYKIDTKESLLEDLKTNASLDIHILDEFLEKINGLDEKLSSYAKHILVSPADENKADDSDEDLQDDDQKQNTKSVTPWKQTKSDIFIASKQRSVEHTPYPGFLSSELTAFPVASLEAPQLLNKITNIQHFKGSFKELWINYFLSEPTVAILQDAFWWLFLDRFQPDARSQALIFNRLADSFVGLFLSISMHEKDLFFQKFADCLAQALYSAFCASFPMSFQLFDDQFRNDLLNTISEWITGTRPPPDSWKTWDLNQLETEQIKALQEDRTHQLKSSLSFDPETFLELDQQVENLEKQVTFISTSPTKPRKIVRESHQAGPGPEIERVSFHLHGKSPLIAHFLAANRIHFEEPAAVKQVVTRTEVEKYPPPFPTYQELIQERKREAKAANRRYLEALAKSAEERRRLYSPTRPRTTAQSRRLEQSKSKSSYRSSQSERRSETETYSEMNMNMDERLNDNSFTIEQSDDTDLQKLICN